MTQISNDAKSTQRTFKGVFIRRDTSVTVNRFYFFYINATLYFELGIKLTDRVCFVAVCQNATTLLKEKHFVVIL